MDLGLPDDAGHGEYTKSLGRRAWYVFHAIMDNYGCDACKPTGQILVSGIHDMVNLHLGKGVFDKKRWRTFLELVAKAAVEEGDHDNLIMVAKLILESGIGSRQLDNLMVHEKREAPELIA